jgi:hypothetical protein
MILDHPFGKLLGLLRLQLRLSEFRRLYFVVANAKNAGRNLLIRRSRLTRLTRLHNAGLSRLPGLQALTWQNLTGLHDLPWLNHLAWLRDLPLGHDSARLNRLAARLLTPGDAARQYYETRCPCAAHHKSPR